MGTNWPADWAQDRSPEVWLVLSLCYTQHLIRVYGAQISANRNTVIVISSEGAAEIHSWKNVEEQDLE